MNTAATQQTAVVIGAGEPFGGEIAQQFLEQQYHVVAVDGDVGVAPDGGMQRVAMDLADRAGLGKLFAGLKPVEILVVNVPLQTERIGFLDISDAQFKAAMQRSLLNVAGAVQCALPYLSNGARIVLVSSRGHLGAWGGAHLMAAGAGMVALARSMALEFAGENIKVNVVAPDFIDSKWDVPAARQQVADTVSFLARADIGVNGETILVDGGRTLRMAESRRR